MHARAEEEEPVEDPEQESVTQLLGELRQGREGAFDALFPLVYEELRALAHAQRGRWRGDETLDTTALVHEAYLKLVRQVDGSWESRAHFLAASSKALRHILINYARDRQAKKRGGGWKQVSLAEVGGMATGESGWDDRILALEAALQRLKQESERQARIVECRFFGGMTIKETSEALGISTATVTRGWAVAEAWLTRELTLPDDQGEDA